MPVTNHQQLSPYHLLVFLLTLLVYNVPDYFDNPHTVGDPGIPTFRWPRMEFQNLQRPIIYVMRAYWRV
ncbi:hypothetical protein D3C72_978810 [compost metagenome]